MLFSGSMDGGGKTFPHASAPRQACNTQLTHTPDMTKVSVQCESIESINPYLKAGSQLGSKDLVGESSVREDHQSSNASHVDLVGESSVREDHQSSNASNVACSSNTLLDNPSASAAADTEALFDSSCSTVPFNDDHLLLELHNKKKSRNVIVQASRMPQRTVSNRSKLTGKHSGYIKKYASLASDRKNVSNGVAEDKSSENSLSQASIDELVKMQDKDLGHQEDIANSLQTMTELVNNLQHSGGTLPVSSRDDIETTCQLSLSDDSRDLSEKDCSRSHTLTGCQKSRSPGTHCGIETVTGEMKKNNSSIDVVREEVKEENNSDIQVVTEEVKEEDNFDDANNSLAARNNKDGHKVINWSNITDHKINRRSPTNIARPSYEKCLFPSFFDDHAADSSLAKPLKQSDRPNSTILCGKMNIASEQCSFSSNSEESNGMLYKEVNEIISSLESPPAKRRKLEAQNSAVDAYCKHSSVDDEHEESQEYSSDFEIKLQQRDGTRQLRNRAIKYKRPIGEMLPKRKANKSGVGKMDLGRLVIPCIVRLQSLKFVTSLNTRPAPKL